MKKYRVTFVTDLDGSELGHASGNIVTSGIRAKDLNRAMHQAFTAFIEVEEVGGVLFIPGHKVRYARVVEE